jgi:hypothetical protein
MAQVGSVVRPQSNKQSSHQQHISLKEGKLPEDFIGA